MNYLFGRRIALCATIFLVGGCATGTNAVNEASPVTISWETTPLDRERINELAAINALAEARARWALKAPANFSYVFRNSCFCEEEAVRPVRVTVRGGVIEAMAYAETGRSVPGYISKYVPTIEILFANIEEALRDADEVWVTYDPELGYPREIGIDWMKSAVDDETGMSVYEFIRL